MYFFFIVLSTTVCSFLYSLVAVASPAPASAKAIAAATNATDQNAIATSADNGGGVCSCAVFLSGQFNKGSRDPPTGDPPISIDPEETFPCSPVGFRKCTTKCLEYLAARLPTSPDVVCETIGRDVVQERAFLFVKNCDRAWKNTRMSAGREFCCKDSEYYNCSNATARSLIQ